MIGEPMRFRGLRTVVSACVTGVLLIAVQPRSGAAQDRRLHISLEAITTEASGHGGEYRDRDLTGGVHVASSLEYAFTPARAAFAELSGDMLDISSEHVSICQPSRTGGCVHIYPRFVGTSALTGFAMRVPEYLEFRIGAGAGAFGSDGTTVGAFVAQTDVAVFPTPHFAITTALRAIVIPSFRGDRLWMAPWMLGFRVR